MGELPAEQEGTQQQSTGLQSSGGCGPTHDGGDRAHDCPDPGVGDAEAFERSVAAGVQEDVERPQKTSQRVHGQSEQSDARNSTGHGEGDGVEGADLSSDQRAVLSAVHVGVEWNLKVLIYGVGSARGEAGSQR